MWLFRKYLFLAINIYKKMLILYSARFKAFAQPIFVALLKLGNSPLGLDKRCYQRHKGIYKNQTI